MGKKRKIYINIINILSAYKRGLLASLMLSIVSLFSYIIMPILNSKLIDNGLISGDLDNIVYYALLIVGVTTVLHFIAYIQSKLHINIQNNLTYSLSKKAFNHMMRLKSSYFDVNDFYQTIDTVNMDINQIAETANQQFLNVIVQMLKLCGGCIGLFMINTKLAVIVVFFVLLRYFNIKNTIEKRKVLFQENLKLYQKFSFWYSDTMNGLKTVKLWNLYKKKNTEFDEIERDILGCSKKIEKMYLLESLISEESDNILSAIIYILGGWLIVKKNMTMGNLFSFLMYSQFTMQPVYALVNFNYKLLQLEPKLENFNAFCKLEEEQDNTVLQTENVPTELKYISLKNVCWDFGGKHILTGINAKFYRGEKIAVIGHNGCGKSTLLDLLLRIKEPSDGTIEINGIDIKKFDLVEYRKLFSVIEQDGYLFNSNVKENIILDETSNFFNRKSEWILDRLFTLKNGIETCTGNRGALLSGGEKQKVLLLRALAKRGAKILILDEATVNYDIESEMLFNNFIKSTSEFDFVFVVTHRIELLKDLDKILVINAGKVEDIGTWETIKNSKYIISLKGD